MWPCWCDASIVVLAALVALLDGGDGFVPLNFLGASAKSLTYDKSNRTTYDAGCISQF